MNDRTSRRVLGGSAGTLWACTVGLAHTRMDIKLYLVVWLATAIVSALGIVAWMARADHGLLAGYRARVELTRLNRALVEESTYCQDVDRMNRHLNRIV